MILGLSVGTFTILHVIISLIGIAAGIVALGQVIAGHRLTIWNSIFLVTTIATSVTGFFFHSTSFGPPHVVGVISLIDLAVALVALYVRHLAGIWRPIYAITATIALYLNAFVGVVQAFQKLPVFQVLAPTQSEPPFLIAQTVLLIAFAVVGFVSVKRLPRG